MRECSGHRSGWEEERCAVIVHPQHNATLLTACRIGICTRDGCVFVLPRASRFALWTLAAAYRHQDGHLCELQLDASVGEHRHQLRGWARRDGACLIAHLVLQNGACLVRIVARLIDERHGRREQHGRRQRRRRRVNGQRVDGQRVGSRRQHGRRQRWQHHASALVVSLQGQRGSSRST